MRIVVTGGAGFIGSNFIRLVMSRQPGWTVINLDKLTYAGNLQNLADVAERPGYSFVRADIADPKAISEVLEPGIDAIVNFAAETHVDRSIEDAAPFLRTNILGVHVLLQAARQHGMPLFLQIGTDEVYGSAAHDQWFREDSSLSPGSPYAASKASADLLIQSFSNTYGLPAILVRCTNNYGPFQFPEKLIPLAIANALEEKPIPIYGDGMHQRDWLYVEDYCRAIELLLTAGRPGEIYNVASGSPQPNLRVIRSVLAMLGKPESLIRFVEDRPGHDRRYALDCSKLQRETGWKPQVGLEEGLRRTLRWYGDNPEWLRQTRSGQYQDYYERHYVQRARTFGGELPGGVSG